MSCLTGSVYCIDTVKYYHCVVTSSLWLWKKEGFIGNVGLEPIFVINRL